jgi:acetyl-CoA synthetase
MEIRTFEQYHQAYKQSVEDPEAFWSSIAKEFVWNKPPGASVLEWDFKKPEVRWFADAELNITENCLDRHLGDKGSQTAIIWEPNDPNEKAKHITYNELFDQVCRLANVLKKNGLEKGDRVCIYMPMVPELAVAVLACARIGVIHSVVFAGFSSSALADRINDAQCKMVLTSDGSFRGSKVIDLKSIVDEGLKQCSTVQRVLVLQRTKAEVHMQPERDVWWHDEIGMVNNQCDPEIMNAEDLLFILYTSGSTGKPKGMVHSCGGYMVYTTYTFQTVFQYQPGDIYWCTADVGWITGHSYIVYGPLAAGGTTVMFEGVPSYPDMGRFWEVVEKHKVNIFYTAPTAIRALEKADLSFVKRHDLSSLKILGTVGEPINEEAWHWYNDNIGKGNCPIVDTWWQTETGGIMISPIAGVTPLKPAFATLPMPGVRPVLMDENGAPIEDNDVEGRLCFDFPWPAIARTIHGNHQRYKETYFSTYDGYYFSGDGCKRDEDGYYRITGRVDDVIIVSGHNLGTAEIESAVDEHPKVVETAVVGFPHDVKGNAVYAYVITRTAVENEDDLRSEILSLVSETIGPIAKPDKIQFVSGLPKTRSGKIMRRILRKIASGDDENLGDTSTLLDPSIVEHIKEGAL